MTNLIGDMGDSWIGSVFEGLVTEISSEAAYSRYYGSIPKSTYDAVVAGRPNVDKTVQFILNGLRDGDMSEEEAVRLSKGLVSADNTTRQVILNRFRGGEYSNALEMLYDMESYDAEASKSALIKNGYVVIGTSGWWVLTCTTTYEASHKYFGGTPWCTASDRLGMYDGYKMFCNYTDGACLMQLSNGDASHPFPEYQFTVSSTGHFETICDDKNHEVSFDKSIELVANEWENLTEIIVHAAPKLVAETARMKPIEEKYQATREAYLARRKDIENAKREKRVEELRVQCKSMNDAETAKWKEAVENRVSSGGYKDPEFIKSVISEYTNNSYDMAVRNDYFRVKDAHRAGNYTIYMICPCMGWLYFVNGLDDNPHISKDDNFDDFFLYQRLGSNRTWLFYAITQDKTNNVAYVTEISNTTTPNYNELMVNIPDVVNHSASTWFIRIPSFTSDSDAVLSADDMKFHLIGKMLVDGYIPFGDINIFYSLDNQIIKCFDKTWNLVDEIRFSDIVVSKHGMVSIKGLELNFFNVNNGFEHKVVNLNFNTRYVKLINLFMFDSRYFVGINYQENKKNIISMETGELVFGDPQVTIQTLKNDIWGFSNDNITTVVIAYQPQNGTYVLKTESGTDIPCDKYGNRIDIHS